MSEKSDIKKLKKQAENAGTDALSNKIGTRFPNSYSWAVQMSSVIYEMETRIRELEAQLKDSTRHINRWITSDATIQITTIKTVNSDTHIQAETTQTINSDVFVGIETTKDITSDTEVS